MNFSNKSDKRLGLIYGLQQQTCHWRIFKKVCLSIMNALQCVKECIIQRILKLLVEELEYKAVHSAWIQSSQEISILINCL